MKSNYFLPLHFVALLLFLGCYNISCHRAIAGEKANQKTAKAKTTSAVSFWLTNPDKSLLFQKQDTALNFNTNVNQYAVINVNSSEKFQSIDGFGFTLTGGSAQVIYALSAKARADLLQELFATNGNDIGISYLRISIGASDLNDHVYTYDDLPEGETDTLMLKFGLKPDKEYIIPVLKEIISVNPSIKILASPWSPPVWMKTNQNSKGGSLKREYYNAYARYFVRYISDMKTEGISIDAITIQNEPLHPGNNPSMLMLPAEEGAFIKTSLGPAFQAAGVKTKIILYDHNADRIDYPLTILDDPEANKYVDGSAFHLYGGNIEALSKVHEAHPDKQLYFTEQWIGAPGNFSADLLWHTKTLIIGATRNWCRNVLEWNLAADPHQLPHTVGGCDRCLGAITIDGDKVTKNPAYYIVAHASKFVRPGSVRIGSDMIPGLSNVAFETPDHKKVLIVVNDASSEQHFNIRYAGNIVTTSLKKGAVGTYVW